MKEKFNALYIDRQFELKSSNYCSNWGLRVQEEIKSYCENYYHIDYIDLYLEKGKREFENHIINFVSGN